MREYYDRPTQVMFVEEDDLVANGPDKCTYCEGIAVTDFIICKCCGAIIYLDEVAYVYEFKDWYDYGCENFYELSLDEEKMKVIKEDIRDMYEWLTDEI